MPNLLYRTVPLAIVVAVIAATPAVAAVRYASPTGTGPAATCPAINPCTIANAVNATYTVDLDEVVLAPGDYNVGTTWLEIMDAVDVHGLGTPSQTRIVSTASEAVYIDDVDARLRDVEISHNTGTTAAVFIENGTVDRVIARSSNGNACVAHHATIRQSICTSARPGGAGLFVSVGAPTAHSIVLRGVTAIGSNATNSYGIYATAASSATLSIDAMSVIARGVFKDIYASMSGSATTTLTLDHSNFATVTTAGGATVTATPGINNQTTAPLFVNAAANDFHQATGSPTIDAGAVDGLSGTLDVDGGVRSLGAAADIGADEFVATPPAAPLIISPASGSATTDTTPTVSGTAAPNSTVAVFAGVTPAGTTSADGSGNWSLDISPALADGAFAITATAANANNVTSPASSSVNLTVDATAPAVLITAPVNGSTTNDNTPQVTFSLTEVNPQTSECRVDVGAWFACTSNDSLAALADGSHTLDVRHTDVVSNVGSSSTVFTVDTTVPTSPGPGSTPTDTTAPQTTIRKHPKRKTAKRKAKFTFTANETNSTFKCKLDRRAFARCKSPFVKRVKPGKHTFRVKATDTAGNTDQTPAVYRWRVLAG